MDNNGTKTETLTQEYLTAVKSGSVCRFVRVSEEGWKRGGFRRHEHRGWGERRHGQHWFRPGFEKRHLFNEAGILSRLLDLGLTKGCSFKVVQGSKAGPVLVEVRGTRIAIGHGFARKLIVETMEEAPE
jgi:Fe2+ transport system protein FeoA